MEDVVAQKEARGLQTYLLWRTRIYTHSHVHTHNLVDEAAAGRVEREGRTAPRILRAQTEGIALNFSIILIGFTLDLSSRTLGSQSRDGRRDGTEPMAVVSFVFPWSAPPSTRVLRLLDGSGLEHFCLK